MANERIYTLFDFMAFILILSPNNAPPVFLLDGSTDTIAIFLSGKSAINLLTNSSTNDDFPAPPVPVTPSTGLADSFAISFISDKIQNLNIKIVNMIGEVIYVEGLEKFVGEYTKQVNLNNFTKGVYFLEITTNDGVVNKKIVLQ